MASVEMACPHVAGQDIGTVDQVSSCLSVSSDASCLTSLKIDSASPRSTAGGVSELTMEAAEEATLEGISGSTNESSLNPGEGQLGEVVLPEGFDDSAVDGGQLSADKWADVLDCTPEDILNFSFEDIAGPINQISLPEPSIIAASFPGGPIPENDLGEVMDWETLSLPDIHDMCLEVAPALPPRGGFKRKANVKEALEPLVLGPIPMKARSKRARGVKTTWASDFLTGLREPVKQARDVGEGWGKITAMPSLSAGSTGTVVSCSNELSTGQVESVLLEHGLSINEVPSSGSRRGSPFTETGAIRRCSHCSTTKTPQWRAGPNGPKTLCNACGVRFKSGRLCSEYRPASSPEFEADKHSNSHRKIVEMRKVKEHGVPKGSALQITVAKPPMVQRRIKKTALQPRKLHVQAPETAGEGPAPDAVTESSISGDGCAPENGPTVGVVEASFMVPASPSDHPISMLALPARSPSPRAQPVSKISVRVLCPGVKSETEASRLAATGSSSCLVELGTPSAGGTLSELFKMDQSSLKIGVSVPEESFAHSALGGDGKGALPDGYKEKAAKSSEHSGAASGQVYLVDSGDSVLPGTPFATAPATPGTASPTAPASPLTSPGKLEQDALQSGTEVSVMLQDEGQKQPAQIKAHRQQMPGAQKAQEPEILSTQHQIKLQKQKQGPPQVKHARQLPQQPQHQAVQQQHLPAPCQMVYYSQHLARWCVTPVHPQGLPQVPFMHHQQHYPYQQQLLLQQQHLPPQSFQQQHMMMQRHQLQQQQQHLQDAHCLLRAESVETSNFPSSPLGQKVVNTQGSSQVSPGSLSAKKQDPAAKPEEHQRDKSQATKWEPARSPALSPLGQNKPTGDQERLREQLRRRQEMGQSIRRQLDTAPKGEQDPDAVVETLPISVAFGHSSPAKVVPKILRPPPPAIATNASNAVCKIGPHLFRRTVVSGKLPISSAAVGQQQPVLFPPEPKMEAPWEDLGSDRIFVRGSVEVKA